MEVDDAAGYFFDVNEGLIVEIGFDIGNLRGTARREQISQVNEALADPLTYAQAMFAVGAHINFMASTRWRPNRRQGNLLDVLSELHAHALLIAEEATAQLASGFPHGAAARWRSLFELMVVSRIVALGGDRVAARYKASHLGELMRTLKRHREVSRSWGASEAEWDKATARVQHRLERAQRSHGQEIIHRFGWAAPVIGKTRPSFEDLAKTALTGDELLTLAEYSESSHHIHATRLGSIDALSAQRINGASVFQPKPVDTFRTFVAVVEVLEQITRTLCAEVHRTHDNPYAVYWSYLCHMIALDVQTEAFRSNWTFDPSFLNRQLGITRLL